MDYDLTASRLLAEVERRMMALPDGWSLAVSDAQSTQPHSLNYALRWKFQEIAPSGSPAGLGNWKVYGPMTPELRETAGAMPRG